MTSSEPTTKSTPAAVDIDTASLHARDANAQLVSASPERHLALLVDAVEEYAIFMLDRVGTVVTWNAGAHRIKGYTAEEILGKHFSDFYTPDDISAGKPERELAQAVEHGQCRDEGWRVRKDDDRFWANVVITALFDSGRLEGFAKVTRDETERKQTEEQVHQLELLTDRERIANALHQSIVHRMFDATLVMQGVLQLISDPVATGQIQAAVELLDDTLKEIRTLLLDLHIEPSE
jgi:PAS domain S-box-containing protein